MKKARRDDVLHPPLPPTHHVKHSPPPAISSGCDLHEPTLQSPTRKFGLRHPKAATMRFDKEFLIVLFLSMSLFLAFYFIRATRFFTAYQLCFLVSYCCIFRYRMSPGKSNIARRSTSNICMKIKSHWIDTILVSL